MQRSLQHSLFRASWQLRVDGKDTYLGYFDTKEAALAKYNKHVARIENLSGMEQSPARKRRRCGSTINHAKHARCNSNPDADHRRHRAPAFIGGLSGANDSGVTTAPNAEDDHAASLLMALHEYGTTKV